MTYLLFDMTDEQAERMRAFATEYVDLCKRHNVRVHSNAGQYELFVYPEEELRRESSLEDFGRDQEDTIASTLKRAVRERARRDD